MSVLGAASVDVARGAALGVGVGAALGATTARDVGAPIAGSVRADDGRAAGAALTAGTDCVFTDGSALVGLVALAAAGGSGVADATAADVAAGDAGMGEEADGTIAVKT